MSGNLKILVHKSWHVWKRENREKVARDERNFKEENEKKEETEKLLLQEKNLELLAGSQSFESAERNDGESVQYSETPFRLFGDIEELDKKNKETRDLIQSRKDKEFQDKRKSGEAPWALGEGAAEKIGSVVPYWYAKPSEQKATSSSSSVIIKSEWGGEVCEEDARKKKDELRKHALDPMRGILKSTGNPNESTFIGADYIGGALIKIEKGVALPPSDVLGAASLLSVYDQKPQPSHTLSHGTEKKEHRHKDKSHKDRERGKDPKKSEKRKLKSVDPHNDKELPQSSRKRSRDNDDSTDANSRHNSSSSSSSSSSGRNKVDDYYSNPINVLRQKRMEREYAERKRASIVLAKADIFGPLNALRVGGLPDGREQRYNQQFHPSIAR